MMWTIVLLALASSVLADHNSDWHSINKDSPNVAHKVAFTNTNERYLLALPCGGAEIKLTLKSEDGSTNSYISLGTRDTDGNTLGTLYCVNADGDGDDQWYDFKIVIGDKCASAGYGVSMLRFLKTSETFAILANGRVPYKVKFGPNKGGCSLPTKAVQTEVPGDATIGVSVLDKYYSGESPEFYIVEKDAAKRGSPKFGTVEKYAVLVPCDGAHFKLSMFGEGNDEPNAYLEMMDAKKASFYCQNGAKYDFDIEVPLMCSKGYLTFRMFKTADDIKLEHAGQVVFHTKTYGACFIHTQKIKIETFDKPIYFALHEKGAPGHFFESYRFSKSTNVNANIRLGETETYFVVAPCKDIDFTVSLYGLKLNMAINIKNMKQGSLMCKNGGVWDFDFMAPTKCYVDNITYEIVKSKYGVQIFNQGKLLFVKTFSIDDGACPKRTKNVKTKVQNNDAVLFLKLD